MGSTNNTNKATGLNKKKALQSIDINVRLKDSLEVSDLDPIQEKLNNELLLI